MHQRRAMHSAGCCGHRHVPHPQPGQNYRRTGCRVTRNRFHGYDAGYSWIGDRPNGVQNAVIGEQARQSADFPPCREAHCVPHSQRRIAGDRDALKPAFVGERIRDVATGAQGKQS